MAQRKALIHTNDILDDTSSAFVCSIMTCFIQYIFSFDGLEHSPFDIQNWFMCCTISVCKDGLSEIQGWSFVYLELSFMNTLACYWWMWFKFRVKFGILSLSSTDTLTYPLSYLLVIIVSVGSQTAECSTIFVIFLLSWVDETRLTLWLSSHIFS